MRLLAVFKIWAYVEVTFIEAFAEIWASFALWILSVVKGALPKINCSARNYSFGLNNMANGTRYIVKLKINSFYF